MNRTSHDSPSRGAQIWRMHRLVVRGRELLVACPDRPLGTHCEQADVVRGVGARPSPSRLPSAERARRPAHVAIDAH